MPLIVLDSSVIIPRFRLDGPLFDVSFAAAKQDGSIFALPQVVFDEVVNKFREQLAESARMLEKQRRDLSYALDRNIFVEHIDLPAEHEKYKSWLTTRLTELQVEVLPYPDVTHEALTRRALDRRKPFCEKGQRGYRDVLIWETVLAATHADEQVLFVSKNSNDFAAPKRTDELHPDLQSDLLETGASQDQVKLFSGLDVLHKGFFSLRREFIDEMSLKLREDAVEGFKIETWVREHLPEALNDEKIARIAFGFPHYYAEQVSLVYATAVTSLNVISAGYVTKQRASLLVEIEVEGKFEISLDGGALEDMGSSPFDLDIERTDPIGYDFRTFYVTLALAANVANKNIEVAEIVTVSRASRGLRDLDS